MLYPVAMKSYAFFLGWVSERPTLLFIHILVKITWLRRIIKEFLLN